MDNDKRVKEAFEQWEAERQKRLSDFALAGCALLHGEAMTVKQLHDLITLLAEELRKQGKNIKEQ